MAAGAARSPGRARPEARDSLCAAAGASRGRRGRLAPRKAGGWGTQGGLTLGRGGSVRAQRHGALVPGSEQRRPNSQISHPRPGCERVFVSRKGVGVPNRTPLSSQPPKEKVRAPLCADPRALQAARSRRPHRGAGSGAPRDPGRTEGPPRLCGAQRSAQHGPRRPPGRPREAERDGQDPAGVELEGASGSPAPAPSPAAQTGQSTGRRGIGTRKDSRGAGEPGVRAPERKEPGEGRCWVEGGVWGDRLAAISGPGQPEEERDSKITFSLRDGRVSARSPEPR